MEKYLPVLTRSALFAGVTESETAAMLACLGAREKGCAKGGHVLEPGDRLEHLCVVVEGSLQIHRDDSWGNRSVIGHVGPGELFGEAYLAEERCPFPNDVVALEDSTVVFLHARKVMTVCPSACPFHARVVRNLVFVLSEKNRQLMNKLTHMSRRTTREKLLSFLSEKAMEQGCRSFSISFDRQQLADYLCVDRSAMSKELGRMRDEGLVRFHRSTFELL